jgi:hypothetical protein
VIKVCVSYIDRTEVRRLPRWPKIKYLGLVLDGLWGFKPHFEELARVDRIANSLSQILPNVGGPGVKARSLYINTVLAVAL